MKWSFYSAGMVMFGLVGMGIIVLFIQLTVNSDEEYYLLKEVTEASMMDSIDITYYRNTGNIKIIKEKFAESFFRRFAQSTNNNANSYQIKISNIVESPPKVSVEITSELGKRTIFKSRDDYNVYSDLDAIIEFNK
ncbi:MAG: DUF5411 family protein [Bacilli bacterium]|nr:DUF5411 family protein [Bacilli bacterium]